MSFRRRAFTLIELLVVIGIVSLLLSLLLPTLNRAREQAKSVTCASNQRQLYVAFMSYVNENRGRVPIPSATTDTDPDLPVCFVMRSPGVCDYGHGTLWPYIAPAGGTRFGVMNCPTDQESVRALRKGSASAAQRNFSYALSGEMRALPGHPDGTGIRLSEIVRPAEKILIVEELWPLSGKATLYNDPVPCPNDLPAIRHGGRGNYCFGDGHIVSMLPTEMGYTSDRPDTDPHFMVFNRMVHLSMTELFR